MSILQHRLLRVAAAAGSEIMLLGELDTGGDAPRRGVILQKLKSFTIIFIFVIDAFGLAPYPAGAAVFYSYAGTNFTNISDPDPPAGTYDTTMSVTGSFTVAAPLLSLPPSTDISASVSSYSFGDGRQTLDNGNSTVDVFRMSTDAAGSPSAWFIGLFAPFPSPTNVGDPFGAITTRNDAAIVDVGRITNCTTVAGSGCTVSVQDRGSAFTTGTWTVTPTVVPLPPAVLLFGSALVALFGFGRFGMRRRRQV